MKALPFLEERGGDGVAGDDGADRGVGGGEALRGEDHVRADVVEVGGEPRADAAEAGDHLVGDEQDAVAVADRADALEVAGGRRERAAGVLDGLHDHHRDRLRAGLDDRRVEIVEQERGELLLGLGRRAVVAVRVADVDHVGDERLEGRAQRGDAVDRERAHRGAVVGEAAGDGLPAALAAGGVVGAGELPRGLDGLGAAGDEEDAVQVARGERRELGGELDRAGVRVAPVGVERQLAHLLERGLADLLAVRVADLDGEQARERVEVAVPVAVFEVAALTADDDRRLVPAHPREVEPEVILGELPEIARGHGAET